MSAQAALVGADSALEGGRGAVDSVEARVAALDDAHRARNHDLDRLVAQVEALKEGSARVAEVNSQGPPTQRLGAILGRIGDESHDPGVEAHLVTGSDDGTARLWAFDRTSCRHVAALKPKLEASFPRHPGGITSVSFRGKARKATDDLILTSSKDRTVNIWDCSGTVKGTLPRPTAARDQGHKDYVNMAVWGNGESTRVLSCSDDHTAIVWCSKAGVPLSVMREKAPGRSEQGHTQPVSMATWSRCEKTQDIHMLTCSHDKTIILWKYGEPNADILKHYPHPSSRTQGGSGPPHEQAVWSAYTSMDEKRIVSASRDKTVKVWDVERGVCIITFGPDNGGHTDMVLGATWSQDDSEVLSHSMDNTAMLWDLRTEKASMKLEQHSACVWSAKWGRKLNSHSIVTASHDMTAMVLDRRRGMPKAVLKGHLGILWHASLSLDEKWAVTCSEDCTARVWDMSSSQLREPHVLGGGRNGHAQPVFCAAFHEPPTHQYTPVY